MEKQTHKFLIGNIYHGYINDSVKDASYNGYNLALKITDVVGHNLSFMIRYKNVLEQWNAKEGMKVDAAEFLGNLEAGTVYFVGTAENEKLNAPFTLYGVRPIASFLKPIYEERMKEKEQIDEIVKSLEESVKLKAEAEKQKTEKQKAAEKFNKNRKDRFDGL